MAKAGYAVVSAGAVSLAAGTAKSVIGIRANAAFGIDLTYVEVGFAGVTATEVPVLVELCYSTYATNGTAGTNNTTLASSIIQQYGRALTHGVTAMKNWTTEPTVLTPIDEMLLTPNGGLVKWAFPLGMTPDTAFSEGFVIRCNAPSATTVRATMHWERA